MAVGQGGKVDGGPTLHVEVALVLAVKVVDYDLLGLGVKGVDEVLVLHYVKVSQMLVLAGAASFALYGADVAAVQVKDAQDIGR